MFWTNTPQFRSSGVADVEIHQGSLKKPRTVMTIDHMIPPTPEAQGVLASDTFRGQWITLFVLFLQREVVGSWSIQSVTGHRQLDALPTRPSVHSPDHVPELLWKCQSKFTSLLKDLERKKFEDETRCLDAFVMSEHQKVALAWVSVNSILPSFSGNNNSVALTF
jgi:hypothetical protein